MRAIPCPVKRALIVDIVKHLPQGFISRAWGWLARRRRPRLAVEGLKRAFVRAVGIDMSEAAQPIGAYACLEDLFVRSLRPGARRIDPDPTAVICPVDGTVGMCGTVADDTLLQVKGRTYSLSRLLDDPNAAARFEGGPYATIYLAPFNYHRIHAPVSGEVRAAAHIPGALMPVFPEALESIDELFARNERLITYIDSPDAGRVAVVKVGATLVGRITVSYDASLHTNCSVRASRHLAYNPPRLMNKGAELGIFELGSTVVLVGYAERVTFEELTPGAEVRVGQRIGVLMARKRSSRRKSRADGTRRSASRKKASAGRKGR